MKKLVLGAAAVGLFGFAGVALAAYSFFGDASVVAGGNPGNAAEIVSDAAGAAFGGVLLPLAAPVAWADFDTLSLDYNITDDNCGGGSPRAQVRVDTTGDGVSDGSVRIALGPSPNFTGCTAGWQTTGNLIGNEDAGRYDYSVFGGSPFTTYSNAPAVVTAGQVVGVTVLVDGSWSAAATGGDSEQTTLVDNINVNGEIETFDPPPGPETKDDCKDGGWEGFGFENQGQCVASVVSQSENH